MNAGSKIFVMCIVAALLVCGSYQACHAAAPTNVIKVRVAGTAPPKHSITTELYVYKKYVEEKSGGRVLVEVYPSSQLFSDTDLPTVLPKGGVDIGQATADMWTGVAPAIGFLAMPFIFDNEDHFWRVANGKLRNLIQEDLHKAHMHLLGYLDNGKIGIMFKAPVAKLEDLKGRRMRSLGRTTAYFAQSLGMAPTTMSAGEVYTALQRGTIDGLFSGVTSLDFRKLYEVAKYALDDADYLPKAPVHVLLANLKFFESQPQDIQTILTNGAKELEKYSRGVAREDDSKSLQELAKNGVKLMKISDDEIARWKRISIPFMISKLKEDVDPKKVDLMMSFLEEERK